MKILKRIGIKPLLTLLIFALVFASCEQETLQNSSENLINETTIRNDDSWRGGTTFTTEEIAYISRTSKDIEAVLKSSKASEVINIPVANHIITRSDGTGGLAPTEIPAIMSRLNTKFNELDPLDEFEINFTTTCHPTNVIRSNKFYDLTTQKERSQMTGKYDQPNALNIYYIGSLMIDGVASYGTARPPNPLGGGNQTATVIVRVDNATVNRTIEHEIGHSFSLLHTHGPSDFGTTTERVDGSNCSIAGVGDELCDTPADPNLLYGNGNGCSTNLVSVDNDGNCTYVGGPLCTDANGDVYTPDIHNIMSYSPIECKNSFTREQIDRVRSGIMEFYSLECCNSSSPSPNSCCPPSNSVITSSNTPNIMRITVNLPGEQWQVQYKLNGSKLWANTFTGTGNTYFSILGIPQNCHYKVRLRKKCGYMNTGWSAWSASKSIYCNYIGPQ